MAEGKRDFKPQGYNRDHRDQRSQGDSAAVQELLACLRDKNKPLAELPVDKFAYEGGYADALALSMKSMKVHQLRKFFGEIKSLEKQIQEGSKLDGEVREEIALLIPTLAYAKGRELITQEFYDVMKLSLQKIATSADFCKFSKFLTAVVAYSKLHGKMKE